MKDLVCLAADRSIAAALEGLLGRPEALRIRRIKCDFLVHPHQDPGCFHEAHEFLRSLRSEYLHGVVVFDSAWEGAPAESAEVLEEHVRGRLRMAGMQGWADTVVIEPELEVWVWSDSPHVDETLGWSGRRPDLRTWLRSEGLWAPSDSKPQDPKAATERALEVSRTPKSASIYRALASSVSVDRCADPSFGRLRGLLQRWFERTTGESHT